MSTPSVEREVTDRKTEASSSLSPETKKRLSALTVIHIAPPWLPVPMALRTYGGVETVIGNLLEPLHSLGVNKQIVYGHAANSILASDTVSTRTPAVIRQQEDYFKIFENDPERANAIYEAYTKQVYDDIRRAARQGKIDTNNTVVHDHTVVGRRYASQLAQYNIPVIATEHERVNKAEASKRAQYNQFAKSPNLFSVAISHMQPLSNLGLRWLAVIPNGINLDEFDFSVEKQGHPELGKYGLFLGSVRSDKGTHNAIQAAQKAGMPLIIAGPIEQTPDALDYFRTKIEPHLSNSIRYIGPVDREWRRVLLRDASWLSMLNEWEEPFGNVIVEALASGTPVIGTVKGSIPGIIKNGVTGYTIFDLKQAPDAIRRIMRGEYDPQACRKIVEEEYSAEIMAESYACAYLKALDLTQKRSQSILPIRRNIRDGR